MSNMDEKSLITDGRGDIVPQYYDATSEDFSVKVINGTATREEMAGKLLIVDAKGRPIPQMYDATLGEFVPDTGNGGGGGGVTPQDVQGMINTDRNNSLATVTSTGHVKVDGETIKVDANGKISTYPLDHNYGLNDPTVALSTKGGWELYENVYAVSHEELEEHSEVTATDSVLGHVIIDNSTIVKNGNGKIQVSSSIIPTQMVNIIDIPPDIDIANIPLGISYKSYLAAASSTIKDAWLSLVNSIFGWECTTNHIGFDCMITRNGNDITQEAYVVLRMLYSTDPATENGTRVAHLVRKYVGGIWTTWRTTSIPITGTGTPMTNKIYGLYGVIYLDRTGVRWYNHSNIKTPSLTDWTQILDVPEHEVKVASETELGHVKVDGTTIIASNDGTLTAMAPSDGTTVIDNLNSTSPVDALSANQGRALKGMIENSETFRIDNVLLPTTDVTTLKNGTTHSRYVAYASSTEKDAWLAIVNAQFGWECLPTHIGFFIITIKNGVDYEQTLEVVLRPQGDTASHGRTIAKLTRKHIGSEWRNWVKEMVISNGDAIPTSNVSGMYGMMYYQNNGTFWIIDDDTVKTPVKDKWSVMYEKSHLAKIGSTTSAGHLKPNGLTVSAQQDGTLQLREASSSVTGIVRLATSASTNVTQALVPNALYVHSNTKATSTELGHVRTDGQTIVSSDGVISAVNQTKIFSFTLPGDNSAVLMPSLSENFSFYIRRTSGGGASIYYTCSDPDKIDFQYIGSDYDSNGEMIYRRVFNEVGTTVGFPIHEAISLTGRSECSFFVRDSEANKVVKGSFHFVGENAKVSMVWNEI